MTAMSEVQVQSLKAPPAPRSQVVEMLDQFASFVNEDHNNPHVWTVLVENWYAYLKGGGKP